jgi:hypothetical protein
MMPEGLIEQPLNGWGRPVLLLRKRIGATAHRLDLSFGPKIIFHSIEAAFIA